MIKLETVRDFPIEVQQLIEYKIHDLKIENVQVKNYLRSERRYWCGFDTPVKDSLRSELKQLLINESFECYHCTKVINPNEIVLNGLHVLKTSDLKNRVLKTIGPYINDNQRKYFIECFDSYVDGSLGIREKMIWFVPNLKEVDDQGCELFFEYYGGEITRRLLYDRKDEFYPILKQLGSPIIVQCSVRFSELSQNHFLNFINSFLDMVIRNTDNIGWEFYLEGNLLPDKIIRIIDKKNTVLNFSKTT